jgi:hypothetical protein
MLRYVCLCLIRSCYVTLGQVVLLGLISQVSSDCAMINRVM